MFDRAIKNTKETRSDLGESNNLLSTMKKNIVKNKVLLYCILFLLVIAVIVIIYIKYFTGDNATNNNDNSKNSGD